jgi:ABC-type multidrug transport system ATPase subunit
VEVAIHTKALTRRFGRAVVVDHLDLCVNKSVITAFLGPNGAGKTTTIRMLLGLLKPQGGSCEVLGLRPGHPEALSRIGALVEQPSLYDHLTGFENVEITRLMKDVSRQETEHVLNQVGLAADARRPVRTYSLGMRQRLGMALALLGEPRLLILDEPNNGLDPAGILEMRELIRHLSKDLGVTVFLSSHLLAEVEQVASHVVVIDKGRLRYQGLMEEMGSPEAEELLVRVDDPERAILYLTSQGYAARISGGDVQVPVAKTEVPKVATLLMSGGFAIYELTPCRVNLEARFLSLLATS